MSPRVLAAQLSPARALRGQRPNPVDYDDDRTTELTDALFSPQIARNLNLNLTPEEKRVFYQLFQAADTTNLGVITGEVAVPFFEKTQLAPETLGLVCRCLPLSGKAFPRAIAIGFGRLTGSWRRDIDMADRRQGKSGSIDPFWVWCRHAADRTRSGGSRTYRGTGLST